MKSLPRFKADFSSMIMTDRAKNSPRSVDTSHERLSLRSPRIQTLLKYDTKLKKKLEDSVQASIELNKKVPKYDFVKKSIKSLRSMENYHLPRSKTLENQRKRNKRIPHILESLASTWKGETLNNIQIWMRIHECIESPPPESIICSKIPKELIKNLAKTQVGAKLLNDATQNMTQESLYSTGNYRNIKESLNQRELALRKRVKLELLKAKTQLV